MAQGHRAHRRARGRQAGHRPLGLDNRPGAEEADARDDLRGDPRGVELDVAVEDTGETVGGDERERARADAIVSAVRPSTRRRSSKLNDAHALAQCVLNVLSRSDSWAEVKKSGRSLVEQERNWKTSVSRYQKIYETLTQKNLNR